MDRQAVKNITVYYAERVGLITVEKMFIADTIFSLHVETKDNDMMIIEKEYIDIFMSGLTLIGYLGEVNKPTHITELFW